MKNTLGKFILIFLLFGSFIIASNKASADPNCVYKYVMCLDSSVCAGCGDNFAPPCTPTTNAYYRWFGILCRGCSRPCTAINSVSGPVVNYTNNDEPIGLIYNVDESSLQDHSLQCRTDTSVESDGSTLDIFGDFEISFDASISYIDELAEIYPVHAVYALGFTKGYRTVTEERRYSRGILHEKPSYDFYRYVRGILQIDPDIEPTKERVAQFTILIDDGIILVESWLSKSVGDLVEMRIMTTQADVRYLSEEQLDELRDSNDPAPLDFNISEVLGETWITLERVKKSQDLYKIISVVNDSSKI